MRQLLVPLLVIGMILTQMGFGVVALTDDASSSGAPDVPIIPDTPPLEPLIIESAAALADPPAAAWDADARLVAASMVVIWPDDEQVVMPGSLPGEGDVTLVYSDGDDQLVLIVDRQSGDIFHAEIGGWSLADAVPLPTDRISRSSSIAVLAAEVSYGTSYRAACPEHRFVTRAYLSSSSGEAGNPAWIVSYVDQRRRDRPDVRVVVDAVTGETLDGEISGSSCEEE